MNSVDRISEALAPLSQAVAVKVRRLLVDSSCLDTAQVSIYLEELARKRKVYRVCTAVNGEPRSLVVKRLDPAVAQRNRLVAERWLPGIGLDAAAPRLLCSVAARDAKWIWHIYEDVNGVALSERHADSECVSAAVDLIAELHTRAAGHPFISECRRNGRDHGVQIGRAHV